MALGALLVASSALAHTVRIDFDHATHFSSYKTYRWVAPPESQSSQSLFPSQILDQRIVAFIEEALASRGLRRVKTGGDLLVDYRMVVTEQPQFVTFGDGWGPGWNWAGNWGSAAWPGGYSVTTVQTFYEGTLVIDIRDANRNKMVFEGTSTQSVSSRPNRNTERMARAVNKIMASYPPQP
jgi:hypothetical protein